MEIYERSSFAKAIKTPPPDIFSAMKESTGKKCPQQWFSKNVNEFFEIKM